jgi:hypothetical protein
MNWRAGSPVRRVPIRSMSVMITRGPMTPPRWGGAGQVRGSENRQLVSSVGILQHDIAVRAVTLPAPRNGARHGR